MMGNRALKKEIKQLEDDLSEAHWKISNLHIVRLEYEGEIKHLRDDLAAEKEKYAALLEKYIAAMEERVKQ